MVYNKKVPEIVRGTNFKGLWPVYPKIIIFVLTKDAQNERNSDG